MKLKIFFAACVSAVVVAFPQNIIGCGPDVDPYDYYTTFFNRDLSDSKVYKPFYYSDYVFLFNEDEAAPATEILAEEWAKYCGAPVLLADVNQILFQATPKDLQLLYNSIEKKAAVKLPAGLQSNTMAVYFTRQKDLEGLGYLLYAKQVEPFVTDGTDNWEPESKDSIKMGKLMRNGLQLYNAAKLDFFKLKYGYQVTRLAHYSGRYPEAIKYYDELVSPVKTKSVLQPMSLALKAGALFHTGDLPQAAYLFSKAFAQTDAKKVSNYMSFRWSINAEHSRQDYLALCRNNDEKANMLAMFALGSIEPETKTLEEIFSISPAAEVLPVLAVREINKLENTYYTPSLAQKPGGKIFYYAWENERTDSLLNAGFRQITSLQETLHAIAQKRQTVNDGLFETGAAYCALMLSDYAKANQYLQSAAKMQLSAKVKDQWQMVSLLLAVNETEKVDAAFEAKILPAVQWLYGKAKATKAKTKNDWYNTPSVWQMFYRNLMSEVFAKRYHAQGDIDKEVLAVGAADAIVAPNGSGSAIDFMHRNLESKDVIKLYQLMQTQSLTSFDGFLVRNNTIRMAEVTDFAGTAFLRDQNFSEAINWFSKGNLAKKGIAKNPFLDLLYDQAERLPYDKVTTTKLAFAKEMKRLEGLVKTDKLNASRHLYKMAVGFYNITYYGYAWELVDYYRSGSDGYMIPKNANEFQRNYYGCFKAEEYFKLAMEKSTDANFKAKCMFMMAKCAQKQVPQPQYEDFSFDWEKYDAAQKEYFPRFKQNKYFPAFVKEYSKTPFFRQAFNTCSYLQDFVNKR